MAKMPRMFWTEERVMVSNTVPPPSQTAMVIQVARPFIYTFKDGNQRRYDPGKHAINAEMATNPWVHADFADGRISHINGRPCHALSQGPVNDHTIEARKAVEQITKVGGNPTADHMARTAVHNAAVAAGPAPKQEGSLNLVQPIEVMQIGHPIK